MLRLVTNSLAVISLACLLVCVATPVSQAAEKGFRLLELDGYRVKWGDQELGTVASVSYAFTRKKLRFDEALNCSDMSPIDALTDQALPLETIAREASAAFRVWERAAGLTFHEVSDIGQADIVIGAQGQPRGRAYANVTNTDDQQDGVRGIEKALICVNPAHDWKVGFDGNEDVYDLRYTLVHEIGHAIGLDHPGRTGQVMAFRYSEAFDDLQEGDLRGVRLLYGLSEADGSLAFGADGAESNDKVFSFNSDVVIPQIGSRVSAVPSFAKFLGIGEE